MPPLHCSCGRVGWHTRGGAAGGGGGACVGEGGGSARVWQPLPVARTPHRRPLLRADTPTSYTPATTHICSVPPRLPRTHARTRARTRTRARIRAYDLPRACESRTAAQTCGRETVGSSIAEQAAAASSKAKKRSKCAISAACKHRVRKGGGEGDHPLYSRTTPQRATLAARMDDSAQHHARTTHGQQQQHNTTARTTTAQHNSSGRANSLAALAAREPWVCRQRRRFRRPVGLTRAALVTHPATCLQAQHTHARGGRARSCTTHTSKCDTTCSRRQHTQPCRVCAVPPAITWQVSP